MYPSRYVSRRVWLTGVEREAGIQELRDRREAEERKADEHCEAVLCQIASEMVERVDGREAKKVRDAGRRERSAVAKARKKAA